MKEEVRGLGPGLWRRWVGEALLIASLLAFPHFVPLPFYSYALVGLAAIFLYLKRMGGSFASWGLTRSNLSLKALAWGLVSGMLWLVFIQFGWIPALRFVQGDSFREYSEYDFIRQNWRILVAILLASWAVGGFYEEVVFRGLILHSLRRWIPASRWSFVTAAGFTSILFGLYHLQQGFLGVVSGFLGSLYWCALYRRTRGNLWSVMISHATYDTAALILIYLGWFGKSWA